MRKAIIIGICAAIIYGCNNPPKRGDLPAPITTYQFKAIDTVKDAAGRTTVILAPTDGTSNMNTIETGSTLPQELVAFAKTAIGVPYLYAGHDPKTGFDCSGFITYVFNHFGIPVPRTSVDFTDANHEVPLAQARPGDLILFTGTDVNDRTVGHMGIVTDTGGEQLQFIHSTSGKATGVIVSDLNAGYMVRLVKVVRVFDE